MNKPSTHHLIHGLLALLAALALTACDNVPTETTPPPIGDRVVEYSGPACSTTEVCTFKVEFWDKMGDTSCVNCHDGSNQSPHFVHQGDVNTAYSQALTVVNLTDPESSKIVSKIAGGHNCGDATACAALATIVEGYISNWAAGGGSTGGGGGGNDIVLEAPLSKAAGASKSLPDDSADFASTVWPLLTANCSGCHVESAKVPQSPFFAESDLAKAYDAIKTSQKINLDDPASSRLVVRLRQEFHNCWDPNGTGNTDCAASANLMQQKIEAFAAAVPLSQVNPSWVVSKALTLGDGIVASGGTRDDSSTIALYQFKSGTGDTAYDTSGMEPALNLTLSGSEGIDYKWVGGWGVEFTGGKAQGATASSRKLRDRIVASGEYSIEAWVVPANVNQGAAGEPTRIISYSGGDDRRNFTLGQAEYRYEFMNRTSNTNANGEPSLLTSDDDEDVKATQQHVVVTYDPINGRKVYVNGVDTEDGGADSDNAGSLSDWDDSFAFVLGGEASKNYRWAGKLRLVAIHNRAMTPAQIQQNFEAGVGEKFFLLFSVSDQMNDPNCFLPAETAGDPDVAQCFVYFTVSQFDDYSYLFDKPTFVSLNPAFTPNDTVIKGLRIGVNGKEPAVGQAYRNVDTTINSTDYTTTGEVLSNLGTVIALEKGPDADEFFLTFETLGSNADIRVKSVCNPITDCMATPTDGEAVPDIGMRTFDEINATMAATTGVSAQDSAVTTTFTTIKQQLPTVENINTFLSAHEIATAQLAIEYCNALVEDTSKRAGYFPGFDFSAAASSAFDSQTKKNLVIDPLMSNIMGTNLASQPATDGADDGNGVSTAVRPELSKLMDKLVASCDASTPCDTTRTATIVKATCAALLGSAVSLVQ
jgi:hypothetical protein